MKRKMILSSTLGTIIGAVGGSVMIGKAASKNVDKWKIMSDKHLALFLLMNEWMKAKHDGKHIKDYFENNDYKSIAIYGLSYVGERLLDELKDCGIKVKYAIDKNADSLNTDIDVYLPDEELPDADVIVVTAIYFFDEIYNNLIDKVSCPIVSFEDVLYEIE